MKTERFLSGSMDEQRLSSTLLDGLNTLSILNRYIVEFANDLAKERCEEYLLVSGGNRSNTNPYSTELRHLSEMPVSSILGELDACYSLFHTMRGFYVVSGNIFNKRESRGGGCSFLYNCVTNESICLFPGYYLNDSHESKSDSLNLIERIAKYNNFPGYVGFLGKDQLPESERIFCLAGNRNVISDVFGLDYSTNEDPVSSSNGIVRAFS